MEERRVAILGLPGSGKTTFLAALWHGVSPASPTLNLTLDRLEPGVNVKYLNDISHCWRNAKVQERTALVGMQKVAMRLKNSDGEVIRLTFPDIHGEAFSDMWETRHCELAVAESLDSELLLFFVHADRITKSRRIVEREAHINEEDQSDGIARPVVPWQAKDSPTQVQVVDILQTLFQPPLFIGPRKLAIILSAWDKVEQEGLTPAEFLAQRLPLIYQYLSVNKEDWNYKVYGMSAQGCDYESAKPTAQESKAAADARDIFEPIDRVKVTSSDGVTRDLTNPIVWLMQ